MFYKCLANFAAMEDSRREVLCKKIENLLCFIAQINEAMAANEKCCELIDLYRLKVQSTELLEDYQYELITM